MAGKVACPTLKGAVLSHFDKGDAGIPVREDHAWTNHPKTTLPYFLEILHSPLRDLQSKNLFEKKSN
jgi:hypothetical protein